jgi:hypothetical protein
VDYSVVLAVLEELEVVVPTQGAQVHTQAQVQTQAQVHTQAQAQIQVHIQSHQVHLAAVLAMFIKVFMIDDRITNLIYKQKPSI